jgi:hypothetical protein
MGMDAINDNGKQVRRVEVNILESLPKTWYKDITADEELCPECHGVGLVASDEGKHRVIITCKAIGCHNGLLTKCKHCGEPVTGYLPAHCEGARQAADQERKELHKQRIAYKFEKAEKITLEEARKRGCNCFYDYELNEYYDGDKLNQHLKDLQYCGELTGDTNIYLYLTSTTQISMDAERIIENACDELHEEAQESISRDDVVGLQKMLDEWCSKQIGTQTITDDYRTVVVITIDDIEG